MSVRRIITRAELELRPPTRPPIPIPTPTRSWLHNTGGPGYNRAAVRGVQDWHMDGMGWSDGAYPFLIGNGQVYELRGALVDHLTADGSGSFVICLMGNRHLEPVPDYDIAAAAWLLAVAILSGWTTSEILGGHRNVPGATPSLCPGDYGMAAIDPINAGAASIIYGLRPQPTEVPDVVIIRLEGTEHRELSDGFKRRVFRDWREFTKYRDAGVPELELDRPEFSFLEPVGRR